MWIMMWRSQKQQYLLWSESTIHIVWCFEFQSDGTCNTHPLRGMWMDMHGRCMGDRDPHPQAPSPRNTSLASNMQKSIGNIMTNDQNLSKINETIYSHQPLLTQHCTSTITTSTPIQACRFGDPIRRVMAGEQNMRKCNRGIYSHFNHCAEWTKNTKTGQNAK